MNRTSASQHKTLSTSVYNTHDCMLPVMTWLTALDKLKVISSEKAAEVAHAKFLCSIVELQGPHLCLCFLLLLLLVLITLPHNL